MGAEGIKIVHASPGRIRLKVGGVKDNPSLAREIQERLAAVQGIHQVEANPLTGSVLVLYRAAGLAPSDSLLALSDSLTSVFPGVEVRKLAEAWIAQSSNGSAPSLPTADSIAGALGMVNAKVRSITGGLDLKVLLPLVLFFFGMRSLFVSKSLPAPTWYDFFWFSLGTFTMLNRSAVDGGR